MFGKKNFWLRSLWVSSGPNKRQKSFAQNEGLPPLFFDFFLIPIMYQDLFSKISKIEATLLCLGKNISKIALLFEIIFPKQKTTSQIFDMLEKRSWYIMGAKKISKKYSGRPPFWAKRFLALIGPWRHPEWPKSKNFFTKRTSMKFFTNDYFQIFIFWLNLSSTAITKKSSENA